MLSDLGEIKKKIMYATLRAQEGHIPSALSVLDIIYVFYKMNGGNKKIDKEVTNMDEMFVLSKGHASLALYGVLNSIGKISDTDLLDFCSFESHLGGHPDRNKVPGVRFSTGSLGHGLALSVGAAMGRRIAGATGKIFCLVGDGELNEGSNWEAMLVASHHSLHNLVCIVDNNLSSQRALDLGNLKYKFESFGWLVAEIDGHNHNEIKEAFEIKTFSKPLAIIANTIKGKGIKKMEGNPAWHHKSPTLEEIREFLEELS
jgi:transketolase